MIIDMNSAVYATDAKPTNSLRTRPAFLGSCSSSRSTAKRASLAEPLARLTSLLL